MLVGGVDVRFVRQYSGYYEKASEIDVSHLARVLVRYADSDDINVEELIERLVNDLDKRIDYMGYDKSEAKRFLSVYGWKYIVILPNGKIYKVSLVGDLVLYEDGMPKPVFERYKRIKSELMNILEKEYKALIEQNIDEIVAHFKTLLNKYSMLVRFIDEKGLRDDFLDFVRVLRSAELDRNIMDEFEEIFDSL